MGAFFTGDFWSFPANAAPSAADISRHVEQIAKLDRVQIELSARPRLAPALVTVLRDKVFEIRPGLPLRLFGYDSSSTVDLTFLEELPMLEHLGIEVQGRLEGAPALAAVSKLHVLSLTPPKRVAVDILRHVPPSVKKLSILGAYGGSKLDLDPIEDLTALADLDIHGFGTNLATLLPRMRQLRKLALRSIKGLSSLDPIAGLKNLRRIEIRKGMYEQLDVLAELPDVRYLHLWSLPKLANVDFISRMSKLEWLFLDAMNTVTRFPEVEKLTKLRLVMLAAMKELRDISALQHAPALEEFVYQKIDQHQRPEDFLPVLRNRKLKRSGFGYHRKVDVQQMTRLIEEAGIDGEVYMYPQARSAIPE